MEIFKSKHVGCYGVVYNDNGEVLLIKKARGAYKGQFDLPGGGIEYGESADETLKREFEEETGLRINKFKLKQIITNYVVWDLDETHQEDLQHIAIIYDVKIKKSDSDTKVTSSANHYTPSTASGQDKTASASGATAAWSIDVVKGVTLNTDGKGHVTGISVTSGKIPANPVPSNNVTGSGTSGYLTKWSGTNTITNGPQLGSSTTTFLRNDGTWATPPVGEHTHAYTVPVGGITIKTGSSDQSHITLQTLMTWLTTTKGYITPNTARSLTLYTSWNYAGNDILQLTIDGTAYELQLAGVIIEFDGTTTDYQTGTFRLRIHSSPTLSFTPASGYTQFPASHIAEYTCNGSAYSPTWKMLVDICIQSLDDTAPECRISVL